MKVPINIMSEQQKYSRKNLALYYNQCFVERMCASKSKAYVTDGQTEGWTDDGQNDHCMALHHKN